MNDPRFRPALIAVAGISTLYTIYLIHNRNSKTSATSNQPSPLRRRNAVRRPDTSRRTRAQTHGTGTDSLEVSEQAVAALRIRQDEALAYGEMICDVYIVTDQVDEIQPRQTEVRWPLLPTLLPTLQSLESHEGSFGARSHVDIRNSAETYFLTAFLTRHFPESHLIGPREAIYLEEQLGTMGISSTTVRQTIQNFNESLDARYTAESRPENADRATLIDGVADQQRTGTLIQTREGQGTTDEQSQFDWRDGDGDGDGDQDRDRRGQNLLNLLFNIASDQAKRNGHVHRGIECNSCGTQPIQGIRYRCANCVDYDLCESCEAQQPHTKTHVFFKIRIPFNPIGPLGNSRSALPVWYPGNPGLLPASLPRELSSRLLQETGYDNAELDALWEQFRCLAATRWSKDPTKLGMAIDRQTFDKCFVPPMKIRSQPANLIYDRLFAFYDTDRNGMIGFENFVKGLASLSDKSRDGRLKRIFKGYDLDSDGYISRRDFLRMFRAFYALSKELNQEIMASMEDDLVERGARELVRGNHPISAAFGGDFPQGHIVPQLDGKTRDANGDMVVEPDQAIVREEPYDLGERNAVIAAAAGLGHPPPQLHHSPTLEATDQVISPTTLFPGDSGLNGWFQPPLVHVTAQDVVDALGGDVSVSEIMDPLDQVRVARAQRARLVAQGTAAYQSWQTRCRGVVHDRWRRRGFYTDVEEGGTAPSTYVFSSSDEEFPGPEEWPESETSMSVSRPISPRSRSSSKVRFDDSVHETDHETRSNTSSRSIPVGERWGAGGISAREKDVAKEGLYHEIQQGFNELLNQLFHEKEDLAMDAIRTKKVRSRYAAEISAYSKALDSKTSTKFTALDIEAWTSSDLDGEVKGVLRDAGFLPGLPRAHQEGPTKSTSRSLKRKMKQDVVSDRLSAIRAQYSDPTPELDLEGLSSNRDPTLPQFRPDREETSERIDASQSLEYGHTKHPLESQPSLESQPPDSPIPASKPNGTVPQPPFPTSTPRTVFSRSFVDKYALHCKVDQEAIKRGGYGRLNYEEFVTTMVWAKKTNKVDVSKDGAGVKRREWDRKEGLLGNLGFVISWIELLSF